VARWRSSAPRFHTAVAAVEKDGPWGVNAPSYTLKKVQEGRMLTDGARAALAGKTKTVAMR
jgi:hypothetical protein